MVTPTTTNDQPIWARKEEGILVLTGLTGWTGFRTKDFTTEGTENTEGELSGRVLTTKYTKHTKGNREEGLEEIARRYLLQPVGGFTPGVREG